MALGRCEVAHSFWKCTCLSHQRLFEAFLHQSGPNVAFIVSATEWAAKSPWPALEKADECFESNFQAGYFLFEFLLSHVGSWVQWRKLEPMSFIPNGYCTYVHECCINATTSPFLPYRCPIHLACRIPEPLKC